MFNFIRVSFCFFCVLILRLGLGIGLGFGIVNLKIFDRWRCRDSGHPRPLDACVKLAVFTIGVARIKHWGGQKWTSEGLSAV